MNRNNTIEVAQNLINGDRQDEYGKAEDNFKRIAERWTQLLGIEIQPWQVGVMMADLKLARLANGKPSLDSFIDGIGYLALASELSSRD
jgi:hypothetical protein